MAIRNIVWNIFLLHSNESKITTKFYKYLKTIRAFMICIIEDNDQIVSYLKNNGIIFALYDFEGFKESVIDSFNIFVISSKRINNKGTPSLSLIKNIKKHPYKKVIIVGDLDDMMKTYYEEVGVDVTTSLPLLCNNIKKHVELYRKLKLMQKYSNNFSELFPELSYDYDNHIIEQIKSIFNKYLGNNGNVILENYMKQGATYKQLLKEGYSLVKEVDKKTFLEEIRQISI